MDTQEPPEGRFAGMLERSAPGRISLGGHRGLGSNPRAKGIRTAKFRENTNSSFLAAVNAGATFIEFDVQVTSDNVPVLFHDHYVVHGHEAAPNNHLVRDLSLTTFKKFAPINSASDYGSAAGGSDDEAASVAWLGGSSLAGDSPNGGSPVRGPSPQPVHRLLRQLRADHPAEPFEPSLRAWEAETEDHLPSLAEVFAAVPPHIAFDIELKMTTPDDHLQTAHAEVERMVSATLAAVDAAEAEAPHALRRDVMFSSFDPEVCAEIKRRRPHYDVMFLSGGGAYKHSDPRRTSVESAVEFAAGAGLAGVILETSVVRQQQHAVAAARAAGLRVMTYGTANDEPDWVRQQAKLGVAGCIVDDVGGVAAALALE